MAKAKNLKNKNVERHTGGSPAVFSLAVAKEVLAVTASFLF